MLSPAQAAGCPLLRLRDAVVRRAGKEILHVDDFELACGENIAVIGPNGAGKSTFIHLITHEVHPLHRDTPPVLFKGSDRVLLAEIKKTLGVVSSTMQDQISVHLPALDIVCGGLFGALGIPLHAELSPEGRQKGLDAMEMLGIAGLAQRDVMTLSSGQARRVLIARELVHDPEVLVFDEPCTGLDPQGMFYVRKSMRDLVAAGKSIVLVTHYPEDIIPEIDRLVLIKDGKVHGDGSKGDILTTSVMSDLFEVPLDVHEIDGYYSIISRY